MNSFSESEVNIKKHTDINKIGVKEKNNNYLIQLLNKK